jgi:PKD repeat protein
MPAITRVGDTLTSSSPTGNQWYLNGSLISGADLSQYIATDTGSYSVVVTSLGCGATSASVDITATGTPPVAGFSESSTVICAGDTIHFSDASSGGNETSRAWTFQGGTPDTGSLPNETVTYAVAGQYSVTLVVSNSSGGDTLTKQNIITVESTPVIPVITISGDTLSSSSPTGNQWYLNDTLIPGDTSAQIITKNYGTYTVVVTNGSNCSATSAPKVYSSSGIISESGIINLFNIIPNPSDGNFILRLVSSGNNANAFIRISDIAGKIVDVQKVSIAAGENKYRLNLANKMPAGIYIVEIGAGNEMLRQKIVVGE